MVLLKFKDEAPSQDANGFQVMNNIFNNLFDGIVTNDFKRWNTPAVNIIESNDEFKLQLAALGMKKEDFKIKVDDNTLNLSAETKSENNENDLRYTRKELSFNGFNRNFTLPDLVKLEGITANYENGIMTVTSPKLEEAKPKSREIKVA